MASLRLAVRAVIGPIGIQVPYKIIADIDANVNAHVHANVNANVHVDFDANVDADSIAVEVQLNIGCSLEILKDSLGSGHMPGEWLRGVLRKSSDRVRDIWLRCKRCIH